MKKIQFIHRAAVVIVGIGSCIVMLPLISVAAYEQPLLSMPAAGVAIGLGLVTVAGIGSVWKQKKQLAPVYLVALYATAIILLFVGGILMDGMAKGWLGESCTGLFGVKESCFENRLFILAILIANPIGLVAMSILALTNIIGSFVQLSTSNSTTRSPTRI